MAIPIRLHVGQPLVSGTEFALPPGAARHAQVRRVQPGDVLQLFDGAGGEWRAEVLAMGRQDVQVRVGDAIPALAELATRVTLAVGMPANERMDTLVEKATELGVAAIQPLLCERSVVRLVGDRAERRREHWQAVAVAAAEQCGRATVPVVAPIAALAAWLDALPALAGTARWLLSPAAEAMPLRAVAPPPPAAIALSGPEGGLSPAEEGAAVRAGFAAVSLGPRILRADTAPLALLAWVGLR
jgi:16S rRNA (uracil1498-N3)-methyltransferase